VLLAGFPDVEVVACDAARDGEVIRTLTRDNFFAAMQPQWDEARHQREPTHPERYRMLRRDGATIGFFALRVESDHVYVQTIQLVPAARGGGIGAAVMAYIAGLAVAGGSRAVRLRVLRANAAARRFYDRLGYVPIAEHDDSSLLELYCACGTTSTTGR
jgi:ribosomal protein S18 acetylase RimI-like enzyme